MANYKCKKIQSNLIKRSNVVSTKRFKISDTKGSRNNTYETKVEKLATYEPKTNSGGLEKS